MGLSLALPNYQISLQNGESSNVISLQQLMNFNLLNLLESHHLVYSMYHQWNEVIFIHLFSCNDGKVSDKVVLLFNEVQQFKSICSAMNSVIFFQPQKKKKKKKRKKKKKAFVVILVIYLTDTIPTLRN